MEPAPDGHQPDEQGSAIQLLLHLQRHALRHAACVDRRDRISLLAVVSKSRRVDSRGGEPAVYPGCSRHYAASASSAVRLRITRVDPSKRMNSFFLRSLSSRVTVSRDEPIICAISSWVRLARMRISGGSNFSRIGVHESSSLASLPAEERVSTRSWMSRYADWNSLLSACDACSPNSPFFSINRISASRSTKFIWHGPAVSAVNSKGSFAITALRPSTSPASAIFRMSTLPSREVVESLALPEHSTKAPRGICPSTNRTALPGYVLKWLAALTNFRTLVERQQNQGSFRSL